MNPLLNLGKRMVFFDGGMGTLLQEQGLAAGQLPELWNFTRPEVIEDIHRQYVAAGAQIIKTNTFGANRLKLAQSGRSVQEVVDQAIALSRRAIGENHARVAMDIGPTGKLLKPLGDLDFEDAVCILAEAAAAGERAGADLILIETMSDAYELKAAVLAAKESTKLPVFATVVVDERGRLLTGGDIASVVALLEGLGVDALGLNCGFGPDQMKRFLPELMGCCSIPVIVNPNAGLPHTVGERTVYDIDPEAFAEHMEQIARDGAWMIGGCCGTTPAHIAAMVHRCRSIQPRAIAPKPRTVVCSYAKAAVFGERSLIIGERINPTGKKRLQQALREQDMDYLLREGISQQQNGADILDVNVGLPGIDEAAMMKRAVCDLQSVTDLPLQIDTSNPAAMEAALRIYNGKPLINSVNGKAESMHSIFPLVKKYGGVVIALTLDENGIPDTAQGRVDIAHKIVAVAAQYGIDRRDIVVDPLAMTISTGQENAAITLEALELLRQEGLYTSLGVSNISFGLPRRELINTAFFTLAMQKGLGAAIINPGSAAMMDAFYAYCALSGADAQCTRYIAQYAGQKAPTEQTNPTKQALSLEETILRGLKEAAASAAKAALLDTPPLALIDTQIIPALDRVGKDFEKGILFLPQLLMSAEAAKAAFEVIRSRMETSAETVKKDQIVLATVKGDIHDIGKNIVKVLLENYGYDVIDLGKDVPPETVKDVVLQKNIKLVGLSALMTTTVVNMEETIDLLRKDAPDCRIMVGGAVLTQEYAERIGADFYSKDAMGAVHIAKKVFGRDE